MKIRFKPLAEIMNRTYITEGMEKYFTGKPIEYLRMGKKETRRGITWVHIIFNEEEAWYFQEDWIMNDWNEVDVMIKEAVDSL